MKFLMMLSFFTLSTASAFAGSGGGASDGGNGGSFCSYRGGPHIPCDLFAVQRGYEMPYAPEQRVPYEKIPVAVRTELERMVEIIKNRSAGMVTILDSPVLQLKENVQIYNTQEFLGQDLHYLGPDYQERQVGYAYFYSQPQESDPSLIEKIQVIEIDFNWLRAHVSARYQAMALLHELLHLFRPELSHGVISPLIKSLDVLLKIDDEQRQGTKRQLTNVELEAAEIFQAYLVHLGLARGNHKNSIIHPYGGGVVFYDSHEEDISGKPRSVSNTNFISVNASVQDMDAGMAYHWKDRSVENRTEIASIPSKWSSMRVSSVSLGGAFVNGHNGSQNSIGIGADVSPVRKCMKFDSKNRCIAEQDFFPVTALIRIGNDTRMEKIEVAVWRLSGGQIEDSDRSAGRFELDHGSCFISIGTMNTRTLPGHLGSIWTASVGRLGCDGAVNLVRSGSLQLVANFDSNIPLPLGTVSLFERGTDTPGFVTDDAFGISIDVGGAAGLRVLRRFDVRAYGRINTTAPSLLEYDYGAIFRFDVNKRVWVNAKAYTEYEDFSLDDAVETTDAKFRRRGLEFNIGFGHDMLGGRTR